MAVGPIQLENIDIPLVIAGVSTIIVAAAWFGRWKPTNAANEPPLLPGGLPILGHALSFGKDSSKLFQFAKDWSTNVKAVSISLMGQRIYVVLSPRDWAAVYRARTLPFEPMVQWALPAIFGMTHDGTAKCDTDPDGKGSMFINQHQVLRDVLGPGDNLNRMTTAFLKYLKEDVDRVYSEVKAAPNSEMTINLYEWARVVLGIASTNAMLGPNLLKNEPDILDRLWQFEKDYFTFTYGLPKWMISKAHENRRLLVESFGRNVRDEKALQFIGVREDMMAVRSMSDYDMGAANFSLWSALQANANPTAFWLLHFILFMPGCWDKVHEEIAPAFDDTNEVVDLDHLVNKTPLLNSMYWETMRWTSGVNSVRKVVEDTPIGGYTFLNGAAIMMPGRPCHFDPTVFGDDADEFVPERFIRDVTNMPGKKNPGVKTVRPFGGGNTLCPGRFFASNEITSFVATIMRTFEFELLPGETMARPATHVPTVGTYCPDHDIKMKLKLRRR